MADIDWSDLQHQAEDVLIPDGDYVLIVTKSEATESSEKKKPMIKLQFAVVEGQYRDRKLFGQLTLSAENPYALQKWFQHLAAFGLDKNYFETHKPSIETLAAELMNRGVIATVGRRTWAGSERNNIENYLPYNPNGPTPPGMILGPARIPIGGNAAMNPTVNNAPANGAGSSSPTPARPF